MSFRETPPPRIEFFSRLTWKGRQHYFRVRSGNGQIISHSEGYRNAKDRNDTAYHLRGGLIEARVFDMDQGGEEIV